MAPSTADGQQPRKGNLSKSTPGSRSSSPSASSRRVQKLNSYLSKIASKSAENLSRAAESSDESMELLRKTNIRRWDGTRRTTTNWDSIRRVSSSNHVFMLSEVETSANMLFRILNFGFPMVTAWYISTLKVNQGEVPLCVFHLLLSNRATAGHCLLDTVPKQTLKVLPQPQITRRRRMRITSLTHLHRPNMSSTFQHHPDRRRKVPSATI